MQAYRLESDKKECLQLHYLQYICVNSLLRHGSIRILVYDIIPSFLPTVNSFLSHSVYRPLLIGQLKTSVFWVNQLFYDAPFFLRSACQCFLRNEVYLKRTERTSIKC